MENSSDNPRKELKKRWNEYTNDYPRVLVAVPFILAAFIVAFIIHIFSYVIVFLSLSMSSVFAFFTSITGFISENYFGLTISQKTLSLSPNFTYISGFTVGALLLSLYIYFAYFYTSSDETEMSSWFYGSIFAGTGTMAFGRLVQFYWSTPVVNTIQNSIIDLINAFSVFIVILIFKTVAEATGIETSFGDVFDTATMKDSEERKEKQKEMNRDISKNNPFVRFFSILTSNPLWLLTGFFVIVSVGYGTLLFEKNLENFIDPNWIYGLVLVLMFSFYSSARKGKASEEG